MMGRFVSPGFWWRVVVGEWRRSAGRFLALGFGVLLASSALAIFCAGLGRPMVVVSEARGDSGSDVVSVRSTGDGVPDDVLALLHGSAAVSVVSPLSVVGVTVLASAPAAVGGGEWVAPAGAGLGVWRTDLGGAATADASVEGLRVLVVGVDVAAQERVAPLSPFVLAGEFLGDGDGALDGSGDGDSNSNSDGQNYAGEPFGALVAPLSDAAIPAATALMSAHSAVGGQRISGYEAASAGGTGVGASVAAVPDTWSAGTAAPVLQVRGVLDPAAVEVVLTGCAGVDSCVAPFVLEGVDAVVVTSSDAASLLRSGHTFFPVTGFPVSVVTAVPHGVPGSAVRAENARVVAEVVVSRSAVGVDAVSVGGAPVALQSSVDSKNVVVTVTLLVVSLMFVANASAAALQRRRSELRTLGLLGWGRVQLVVPLLGEQLLVVVPAGVLGAIAAATVIPWVWPGVSGWSGAWSLLFAVGLSVGAGLPSMWVASRLSAVSDPVPVAPGGTQVGARVRSPGLVGLAVRNAVRVPVRSLVGIGGVGLAAAAVSVVVAVEFVFGGAVVGSVWGLPFSVRSGVGDVPLAGALVLLASVSLADVITVNVRDRREELRVLERLGWSGFRVVRVLAAEGAVLAVCGAGLGAAVVGVVMCVLVGSVSSGVVAAVVVSAVVVGTVAVLVAVLSVVFRFRSRPGWSPA